MIKNYKRGDIIYVNIEKGMGSEQGGRRPAIIIQNDIGNRYSPTTIVAFLTSKKNKSNIPTHVYIDKREHMILTVKDDNNCIADTSIILCEQIRTIDQERIDRKIGRIKDEHIHLLNKALAISIGL